MQADRDKMDVEIFQQNTTDKNKKFIDGWLKKHKNLEGYHKGFRKFVTPPLKFLTANTALLLMLKCSREKTAMSFRQA